jgi:hypothetical protein
VVECGDPKIIQAFLRQRFNPCYSNNPNAHTDDETGETTVTSGRDMLISRLAPLFAAAGEPEESDP